MMELLGIVASPRKMGNCELIVKAIAEKVPPPARLRIVRLSGKEIRSCKACYRCLSGDCPIEDDFGTVEEAMASAAALAEALVDPVPRPAASPSCTECGGTYFEFRGGDLVYCLLCGAGGSVLVEDGRVRLRTVPPAQGWRGNASMHAHGEWLREMRERYLRERTRLKEAALRYAGGEFI